VADDYLDAFGDQLVGGRDRLLRIVMIISNDGLHGFTEKAAGRVDLGNCHLDPALLRLAVPRHLAGERRAGTDQDLSLCGR
jgi:hypothetical protein